jgi:hypothetical protein
MRRLRGLSTIDKMFKPLKENADMPTKKKKPADEPPDVPPIVFSKLPGDIATGNKALGLKSPPKKSSSDVPPIIFADLSRLMAAILDGSITVKIDQTDLAATKELADIIRRLQAYGVRIVIEARKEKNEHPTRSARSR